MITKQLMESLFPTRGLNPRKFNLVRQRDEVIAVMNRILPKYQINTYLRICAFLSNCGIETDYFRTTEEYASGWAYDISVDPGKARSLGNFKKGDGPRYKGSGLSQTTGGFNFAEVQKLIGDKLGINVLKNPEILRDNLEVAVESACIFWQSHNLNAYADKGLFKQLSAIVNRGDEDLTPNHWTKRNELYSLCKRRVPADFSFAPPLEILPLTVTADQPQVAAPEGNQPEVEPAAPTAPESEPSKVKEFSDKYLKHCPQDTVKNILTVIAARIGAAAVALWQAGFHGKVLVFLIAFAAVAPVVWACVKYKSRLFGWIKDIADSFITTNE